ncbi:hypothetical protein [Iodobacter ciconiae]|uniref:Uncharacterized protein n=1 Tax=Iodobacter ciconiae TaxID=2496266 RepID=A0A3S8ZQ08_9NEIS|nr:hypothetical protein [Iodobacter ciconiae]AZN35570.1 hypothetical protein EJO50_03150 [Iodobacter ciconiae]
MQCLSCNSEKTQSISSLHEEGISNISTSCKAEFDPDFSGHFAKIFGISNNNPEHTFIHQKTSPPTRFPILKPAIIIFLFFTILIFSNILNIYSLSIWVASTLAWALIATIYNKIMLPAFIDVWSNSFYCHNCKYVFDEASHFNKENTPD